MMGHLAYIALTNDSNITSDVAKGNGICPKCGVNINTGKRSCCVRGGSWFDKCGTADDNFEHTWVEGMQACDLFANGEVGAQVMMRHESISQETVVISSAGIGAGDYVKAVQLSFFTAVVVLVPQIRF